jgi:hypothetical protein
MERPPCCGAATQSERCRAHRFHHVVSVTDPDPDAVELGFPREVAERRGRGGKDGDHLAERGEVRDPAKHPAPPGAFDDRRYYRQR